MPIGRIHSIDRDRGGVQEGREFTNPQVRFRRIRGRIVPIFNEKRIGQDVVSLGMKAATTGAVILGASLAARAVGKTKLFRAASNVMRSMRYIALPQGSSLPARSGAKGIKKALLKGMRITSATFGFAVKHRFKLGAALTGLGATAVVGGKEIEARSPFGSDLSIGGE